MSDSEPIKKPSSSRKVSSATAKAGRRQAVSIDPPPHKPAPEPDAPLLKRVADALQTKLSSVQITFVHRVRAMYAQLQQGRSLTAWDLHLLVPDVHDYGWNPLQLWRQAPRSEFELWLYLAWELRRRGVAIPSYMEAVTDFSLIEAQMKVWDRERAIEGWKDRLAQACSRTSAAASDLLDFRLVIFPTEARLQWKMQSDPQFRDFKQTHARRFSEQHEANSLAALAEALPLWSAVHRPWDYTLRPTCALICRTPSRSSAAFSGCEAWRSASSLRRANRCSGRPSRCATFCGPPEAWRKIMSFSFNGRMAPRRGPYS